MPGSEDCVREVCSMESVSQPPDSSGSVGIRFVEDPSDELPIGTHQTETHHSERSGISMKKSRTDTSMLEKRQTEKTDRSDFMSSYSMRKHRSIFTWRTANDDDDEGGSPPDSPRSPKKKGKGAIVEVDMSQGTRISAFDEISDSPSMVAPRQTDFAFRTVARKSLLVGLVTHADVSVEDAARDIAEYTGASEEIALTMYLGVVIGIGAVNMPSLFKDTGLIVGVLAIICFALVNQFLAHRLIDVPHLARQSFAGYADISLTLFDKVAHYVNGSLIVLSWFLCCLIFYFTLLYYIDIRNYNISDNAKEVVGFIVDAIVVLAVLPLTFYTDAKRLRVTAKLALNAMYATGFLVLVGGLVHGIQDLTNGKAKHNLITPVHGAQGALDGVTKVGTSFAGLAILPYIVSEMIQPHKAKAMMRKANFRMSLFYIGVGLVGYFGWGDNVQITMVKTYTQSSNGRDFYWILAQVTSVLMGIKSFATFPLFVWPMYREVDSYLKLDSSPPIQLNLPWAINRFKHIKLCQRIALCTLLFAIRRICPHGRTINAFAMVPIYLTQLVIVPFFSITAIKRNLNYIKARGDRDASIIEPDETFGDKPEHLYKVYAVGGLSILLGAFLIWKSLESGFDQLFYNRQKGSTTNSMVHANATMINLTMD